MIGVIFLNKILINDQSESGLGFAIQPLSKGFSLMESGVQYEFYKDKLKSYPEPDKFKSFEYSEPSRQNGGSYGAGKNNDLEFFGECSDKYYTILIYGEGVDYRIDPSSAKFNQAFECPKNPEEVASQLYGAGKKFKFIADQNTGLQEGKYYIIFADQGEEGNWYNPR